MDMECELSSIRVERNGLAAELDAEELWNNQREQEVERRIAELQDGRVESGSDVGTPPERAGASGVRAFSRCKRC